MQFREIDDPNDPTPAPTPSRSLPPNVISGMIAQADGDVHGITVSFTIVSLFNIGIVQLLRYNQNSDLAAGVIFTAPRQAGLITYDDRDASIIATQQWYWVRVYDVTDTYYDEYGPVNATLVPAVPAPNDAITWLDASHEQAFAGAVQCFAAVQLKAGIDFRSLRVYVNGYGGVMADQLIAQDTATKIGFVLKQQGDPSVTVKATVVNSAGAEQSILGVPSKLLVLGSAPSTLPGTRPCRVRNIAAIEGQNGTEFTFDPNPEPSIKGYKLYRAAAGGGFGAAALVAQIVATTANRFSIMDPQKGRLIYEWYVSAVSLFGEGDPSVALQPAITY